MRKRYFAVLILGIILGLYLRSIFDDRPAAAKIVTIRSRNLEYQMETTATTLGEFIAGQLFVDRQIVVTQGGREVGSGEEEAVSSGMVIGLATPLKITIADGGDEPRTITTTAQSVGDLLQQQEIGLAVTDRVTPSETSYLAEGMTVQIDRIVDLEITETSEIPFAVNIEHDPSSFYGREEILSAGRFGAKEQKFMITYENGIEIKRRLLSETLLRAPQDEKRRFGTRIEIEQTEEGRASWYAYKSCLCAAHPSYMKGRYVRVTVLTGPDASLGVKKSVIVRINDRGPDQSIFPERVIDLDAVAYKALAPLGSGTIAVRAELLK